MKVSPYLNKDLKTTPSVTSIDPVSEQVNNTWITIEGHRFGDDPDAVSVYFTSGDYMSPPMGVSSIFRNVEGHDYIVMNLLLSLSNGRYRVVVTVNGIDSDPSFQEYCVLGLH